MLLLLRPISLRGRRLWLFELLYRIVRNVEPIGHVVNTHLLEVLLGIAFFLLF